MSGAAHIEAWTDANQRVLVAEFARIKARLLGAGAETGPDPEADTEARRAELDALRRTMPQPAAIDMLAEAFGLSAFERDVVLLAAGAEMDAGFAALCASASGQPGRPWATFGLALAALDDPHWSALAQGRPLRRWRLIDVDQATLLTSARLRVDETVLHYLAGVDDIDPHLAHVLRPVPLPARERVAASQRALADRVAGALAAGEPPLVLLHGDDAAGREDVAACVAAAVGLRLVALDGHAVPGDAAGSALLATLWRRDAVLGLKALFVDSGDEPPAPALRAFIERLDGPVFVGADEPPAGIRRPAQQCRVMLPPAADQRALWETALEADADVAELDAIVSQFRFGARRIAAIAASVRHGPGGEGALWEACRDAAPGRLAALAQRVEPGAGWEDLILPEAQKAVLRQIVVHMRRRFEVHDRWGFGARQGRGLGVTALFAGDSGTGKTLAAEVLATTLRLALYRVDLSAVVSKYIGETEKNLRRVFDAAEDSGAILLFDEADALFGKRSDVRDSHDRYANIEVSYLLQRMEAYRGLAILTTNHKTALDTAFMRRLRFVVQFPFPEAGEREAIWRRAFPAATPTAALAWDKLARLQVAGGHIQNIALAAAFNAAEAAEPVNMAHVLQAARADAAKRERAIADAETRGWA